MTTAATREHPEIIWDNLKYNFIQQEEYFRSYICIGHDSEGNKWTGTAEWYGEDLEEISEIERY